MADARTRNDVRSDLKPNERWWQEQSGWPWYAEIQKRKVTDDLYLKEEAYLEKLFTELAADWKRTHQRPLRILEFGCGFGRHLKYIDRIDGIEACGCDQSEAMLSVARTILSGIAPELAERLRLIPPRGKLPYEDGSFDVVFSVAVLIHVAPEDLSDVLGEIQRVSAGRIIHLECEPAPGSYKWDEVHNGCWFHDIVTPYLDTGRWRLDIDADMLGPRFAVYDITRDDASPGVRLAHGGRQYNTAEEVTSVSMTATLDTARYYLGRKQHSIDVLAEQKRRLTHRLNTEVPQLRAENSRLAATLEGSRAFRFGQWLKKNRILYVVFASLFAVAAWLGRLIRRRPAGVGEEPSDGAQDDTAAAAHTGGPSAAEPNRSEGY